MADVVQIPGTREEAKIRSPVGVLLLNLITVGIYGIYWWYAINREMAELGRARNDPSLGEEPGRSLLAVTLGAFLIVPPFVSLWNTCKRIERAQTVTLGSNNFSPPLAVILTLFVITAFITPIVMQSNLNQVWEESR